MKKFLFYAVILILVLVLLFSAWKIVGILGSYREGEDAYAALTQYVSPAEPASVVPNAHETAPVTAGIPEEVSSCQDGLEETDDTVWPLVDFEQLAQINPDIVGWILIEGTDISYPVVQGADNDYYLRHLFDGTYNSSGSIFLDAYCSPDFSDPHSIIYGHHMKNDSMFSGLMEYKDQQYYEAHPTALLVTPTASYKIQFFSGYVTDNDANAWETEFTSMEFADWLLEISGRSAFSSEFFPGEDDRIVTLSTCSYEFDDAKFVLHGYISTYSNK